MSKPHQENTSLPLPTISQATAQHRRCRLVTSADASIPDRRGLCLEPSSEPNQRVLPIASDNRAAHGCSDGNIRPRAQPVFEFASSSGRATPGTLLLRRPVALLALVPRPLVLFAAAAVAGAVGAPSQPWAVLLFSTVQSLPSCAFQICNCCFDTLP